MTKRILDFGVEKKSITFNNMFIDPMENMVSFEISFEDIDLELVEYTKAQTAFNILLEEPNLIKIVNIASVNFSVNENQNGVRATLSIHGEIAIVNK